MYGCIETVYNSYGRGFYIRVDGFKEMGYYGYTKREAIRKYRRETGLVYKKITFIEI